MGDVSCSAEIRNLRTLLENEQAASAWRIEQLETRIGVLEAQLSAANAAEGAALARVATLEWELRPVELPGKRVPPAPGSGIRLVHDAGCRIKAR